MQPGTQPSVSIPAPVPPSELEPLAAPPPPATPVYNAPTTNVHSHSLGDSSGRGTWILISIVSAVLLIVISGAGGWFLGSNSTSDSDELDSAGSVDANLVGTWFSEEGDESIRLGGDGSIYSWSEKIYTCANGETVSSSWVNDGMDDCDDGTDEGVSDWTPGQEWVDFGIEFFGSSSNNTQSRWYVNDDSGFLCIEIADSMEGGGNGNTSNSVTVADLSYNFCLRFEKTGDIIWMFSDEQDGEVECEALADMNRNNGPMGTDDGTVWREQWMYVYSDYVDQKPQWCTTVEI